ncbi:MAG: transglutaminase domain-containing protein [Clostridia bacterium]|nr:transglutaminase domain-containing protein [Clostridia bacterium]
MAKDKNKKLASVKDERAVRAKKKSKKAKKLVPETQRPLICPPDKASMKLWVRIVGYVCRAAVIFMAAFGLTFFMCDALRLEQQELSVSAGFLALVCVVTVAVIALMKTSKYGAIGGAVAIVGGVAAWLVTVGNAVDFVIKAALTLKNVIMTRLYNLGYYGMGKYMSEISYNSGFSMQTYLRFAFAVIAIVISLIFVLSCIKRVRVIVPVIVSVAVLGVIFTYNISRSNWGVAMIIASYTGLIVMAMYDKIFTVKKPDAEKFDGETVLFADDDRPELPEGELMPAAAKLLRKQKKAEFKALKKKHKKEKTEITVEEELSNYFGSSVKAKKQPKRADKKNAESDAERAERKARQKQLRRAIGYDKAVSDARAAHGGFAAFGAFALAMLMLIMPALTVKSSFSTIDVIDEKMEEIREYVTALLMGDDPILDDLGYKNDKSNFIPHSTDATPKYYTGELIMEVEVPYAVNVYLRGWIGVDYEDGAWLAVDDESFNQFREIYGNTVDPSEIMFDYFYSIMEPSIVEDKDFLKQYTNKSRYGIIAMQINMDRAETEDSLVYLPAHFRADDDGRAARAEYHGLYEYGTNVAHDVTFVNYFDGLYTGRKFMSELAYASVAYVTTMKTADWYENVAELIAEFNQGYNDAYEAIEKYAERKLKGRNPSLDTIVEDMFPDQPEELLLSSLSSDGSTKTLQIQYPRGVAEYIYDMQTGELIDSRVISLTVFETTNPDTGEVEQYTLAFAPPDPSLAIRFRELMTAAQRRELANAYYWQYVYEDFVYDTYTDKADSRVISELVDEIIEQNSIITERVYNEETGSYETLDLGIDEDKFEPAYERNSEDVETYEKRHELIMAFIDYMQENNTYTLQPTAAVDASLDGVENFLTVTKEGYCVQYASALTLMLREVGIPARYVEGYVACDYHRNYAEDAVARYATTVRDYNEHAWVEVWYDGIGWVQYEATPVYYEDMYVNGSSSSSGTNVRPWYDPEDDQTVEQQLIDDLSSSIDFAEQLIIAAREDMRLLIGGGNIKRALDSIESTLEQYRSDVKYWQEIYTASYAEQGYDGIEIIAALEALTASFESDVTAPLNVQQLLVESLQATNKLMLIIAIIALAVAAVIVVLILIGRWAKRAEKRRMAMIDDIIAGNVAEDKRRETAKWLSDSLSSLLSAYGSAPKTGEFRDEYAARLEGEYLDIFGQPSVADGQEPNAPAPLVSDTDFGAIFNAIAAEEFGDGMDDEQMMAVAQFYKRLRGAAKSKMNILKRLLYHYIKHII